MLFIDAEQVHALLDYGHLVDALEEGHREGVEAMEDMLLEQPSQSGKATHFLARAAWQRRRAFGIKLATVFPDNETHMTGLPTVQGTYVLFDGTNGKPVACIDGTALTLWKTAADSALGARFLARQDAEAMLMVGAGALAPHLITAHTTVRPSIRRVAIWNRTRSRAARLAAGLALEAVAVADTADLEAAARQADVISCATMATAPLIKGDWLKPGAHLDLVGGYTPETREADDEAARRARIFVNSRLTTIGCCGDIVGPMEAGVISETDIVADLFELCRGERAGRESAEEVTFYKNGGGGHLDLMTARFVVTRAAEIEVA
ncbi:MAG: ornithine cyclodeaminase family protein [Kiloniellales bacterium]